MPWGAGGSLRHLIEKGLRMNVSNADVAPTLLNVEQCRAALNLGRSKIYQLIASGDLPSVRVGRRRLVPAHALSAWVRSLTDRA
jgi:excisionase family DNA binding protein